MAAVEHNAVLLFGRRTGVHQSVDCGAAPQKFVRFVENCSVRVVDAGLQAALASLDLLRFPPLNNDK
jgi:hypothetical protein